MPHSYVQTIGMIDQLQKFIDVLTVIQRLTDAHEHNVTDHLPGILLGKNDLIQKF